MSEFFYRPSVIRHYLKNWELLEEGIAPRLFDGMPRKPDYWESSFEEAAIIKSDIEVAVQKLATKELVVVVDRYMTRRPLSDTTRYLRIMPSYYHKLSKLAVRHIAEILGWKADD